MKDRYVFKGHDVLKNVHLSVMIRMARLYDIPDDKEMCYAI